MSGGPTAMARETERSRVGAMVTNDVTRNPAIIGKSILTVDLVSGRVEAAVGGGFYPTEHAAIGIAFLDGRGERQLDDRRMGFGTPHRPPAAPDGATFVETGSQPLD